LCPLTFCSGAYLCVSKPAKRKKNLKVICEN
jgi:hypothetical protein